MSDDYDISESCVEEIIEVFNNDQFFFTAAAVKAHDIEFHHL